MAPIETLLLCQSDTAVGEKIEVALGGVDLVGIEFELGKFKLRAKETCFDSICYLRLLTV